MVQEEGEEGHGVDYAHAVSARTLRRLDSVGQMGARVRMQADSIFRLPAMVSV
jgi:hypothetical protein